MFVPCYVEWIMMRCEFCVVSIESERISSEVWISMRIFIIGYFLSVAAVLFLGRKTKFIVFKSPKFPFPTIMSSNALLPAFNAQMRDCSGAVYIKENCSPAIAPQFIRNAGEVNLPASDTSKSFES